MNETPKIKVEWMRWNYNRQDGQPHWLPNGEQVYDARETEKSFIVQYGEGAVRKTLPKFRQRGIDKGEVMKTWTENYGTHDRCSYAKLIFTLV